MKYFRLLAVQLLFCSILPTPGWAVSPPAAEQDAERILVRYFEALVRGDTATLRSLTSGPLLEKRDRLLKNPMFPAHLKAVYGNASFRIVDRVLVNSNTVSIETEIILVPGDSVTRHFLLTRETRPNGTSEEFAIYADSITSE